MDYQNELRLHDIVFSADCRYEEMRKILPHMKQDYRQENGFFHIEYRGDIGGNMIACSLLFGPDGGLKQLMLFPDYGQFCEGESAHEGRLTDARAEREACAAWLRSVMALADGGHYPWGRVRVMYERWSGRACVQMTFEKIEF